MKDMYIASCADEGGIYHYQTDGEKVIQKQFYPIPNPMYLERKGNRLYAVLRHSFEKGESCIVSFTLDENGDLADQSGIIPAGGREGCHLAVTDSGVFVSNYTSGSVFRTPDLLVRHQGSSINAERQEMAHPHCTTLTPDGKYICVADLGMDRIILYDRNLEKISETPVTEGFGPRHIAFSEDGRRMYCVCELSSMVCSFLYDDGKLSYEKCASALPDDFCGESAAAAIRIKKDRLYTSNRGHDSIAVFDIGNGTMKLLETVPCGGSFPRDFNILDDLLVCTNELGNSVTFFDLKNKIPCRLPFSCEMVRPLCVVF